MAVQVRCLIGCGRLRPAALAPDQAAGAGLRRDTAAEALSPEEALLWRVVCTWLQAGLPPPFAQQPVGLYLQQLCVVCEMDQGWYEAGCRMRLPPKGALPQPAAEQWHRYADVGPLSTQACCARDDTCRTRQYSQNACMDTENSYSEIAVEVPKGIMHVSCNRLNRLQRSSANQVSQQTASLHAPGTTPGGGRGGVGVPGGAGEAPTRGALGPHGARGRARSCRRALRLRHAPAARGCRQVRPT